MCNQSKPYNARLNSTEDIFLDEIGLSYNIIS